MSIIAGGLFAPVLMQRRGWRGGRTLPDAKSKWPLLMALIAS